jgi:hypothetical protein
MIGEEEGVEAKTKLGFVVRDSKGRKFSTNATLHGRRGFEIGIIGKTKMEMGHEKKN